MEPNTTPAGRPAKGGEDALSCAVRSYVDEETYAAMSDYRAADGLSEAAWVRQLILRDNRRLAAEAESA